MRIKVIKCFFYAVLSSVLLISCAGTGTRLTQTNIDEARRGNPVSDILVIGLTYQDNEEVRSSFEDSFVTHLKAAGVDAISSVDSISIPSDMKLKKEEILKVVDKFNNDAVIVTYLSGKDQIETYTPSVSGHLDFYDFYGRAYGYTHNPSYSPGYLQTNTSVYLSTNLYDVKTEKLIWSGKSETMNPDSSRQLIDDVVKAVIQNLKGNKLIP